MTIRKPGGWISILLISTFNSLVSGYKLDYVIIRGGDELVNRSYRDRAADDLGPVSYTHLTLPTNREV